jgi:hypothetical protein
MKYSTNPHAKIAERENKRIAHYNHPKCLAYHGGYWTGVLTHNISLVNCRRCKEWIKERGKM